MESMFPPPNYSGKSRMPAKMSGRWVIALALLFLVMVVRHHGGQWAKIARHQIERWLIKTTQVATVTQIFTTQQPVQKSGNFVMPIANPQIYQAFGWDVQHHPVQFHNDLIIGNPHDVTVISGMAGQVTQVTSHSLTIRSNHMLITYGDLQEVAVTRGQKISPNTVVAQLGSTHRMTIAVTDQGLPVDPLVTSFFGPRASLKGH